VSRTVTAQTTREHLEFALALHRVLAPDALSEVCWSPVSVASALGLAAQGARGDTREELIAALHADDLDHHAKLLSHAAELEPADYGVEPPVLAVSNTLWAKEDLPLVPGFVDELARWPGGSARPAPFMLDPERARKVINDDVAETTRGLIPELLKPGSVQPDTVAALVNALYLRTGWLNPFADRQTEPRPFHAVGGTRDVPTMRLQADVGYAARDGWRVVTLPAAGGVEAVVLLPDHGLPAAEAGLEAVTLAALLDAAERTHVDLSLPRLEVSTTVELAQGLEAVGVHRLFTPGEADLRGLTPVETHVSKAVHQAVLRVDEQGLEGAAATAMMISLTAFVAPPQPVVVRVDRPFLLLVRHRASGAVYFLARIVEP
jgi:serine protease inhibitor